jgi:hypothetical protein
VNSGSTRRSEHLRHATEVATGIDAEEEVDWASPSGLLERFVQSLVSRISRAPDLVLDRLVHIFFRVGLDNEVTRLEAISCRRWNVSIEAGVQKMV